MLATILRKYLLKQLASNTVAINCEIDLFGPHPLIIPVDVMRMRAHSPCVRNNIQDPDPDPPGRIIFVLSAW